MEIKENDYKISLGFAIFFCIIGIVMSILFLINQIEDSNYVLLIILLIIFVYLQTSIIEKLEYKLQEVENGRRKKE
jgi:type III secretory pathway component EscS